MRVCAREHARSLVYVCVCVCVCACVCVRCVCVRACVLGFGAACYCNILMILLSRPGASIDLGGRRLARTARLVGV